MTKQFALIVVCLTLAGCSLAKGIGADPATVAQHDSGALAGDPAQPTKPAAELTEPDEQGDLPCVLIQGTFDPWPQTLDFLSSRSAAVVVGRFAGYGESYWNTPDGSPPDLVTLREGRAEIRTPILIEGADELRGEKGAGQHAVLWNVGKVGCIEMTLDTSPDLEIGAEYTFFMRESKATTKQVDADLSLMAAWLIDAKGQVATEYDGKVTITELDAALKADAWPDEDPEPQETSSEPDPDSGWP